MSTGRRHKRVQSCATVTKVTSSPVVCSSDDDFEQVTGESTRSDTVAQLCTRAPLLALTPAHAAPPHPRGPTSGRPMTPAYLDDLAVLRDNNGRRSLRRDEHPRTGRLDVGVHYEIPGPGVLAERFALPLLAERELDVFQRAGSLVSRPAGSDAAPTPLQADDVAEVLRCALLALPERADAGRQYRDVRLFIREGASATVSGYLADVVTATRLRAARWHQPKPRLRAAGSQRGNRERAADHRRRVAAQEETSARWWLTNFLGGWGGGDEAPEPGSRRLASHLFAEATECLAGVVAEFDDARADGEPWEEYAEDEGYPPRPRVPGRTRFYTIADEVLGPRRRSHGITFYLIPALPTAKEDRSMRHE